MMLHKYPGRIFLLGITLAFLVWELSVPYVCCARITYPLVSKESSYVTLPFFQESTPASAQFTINASLYFLPFQDGILELMPDDCIVKININDNPIDNAIIEGQPHCSGTKTYVDITSYLHPGQNDVEIQLNDFGGLYGLGLAMNHTMPAALLVFAVLGLSFYALVCFMRQNTLPPWLDKHREIIGIALIVIAISRLYIDPIVSTHQWFFSHANIIHPYVMEMFKDAFAHGLWYPRWLPNLQGGYGYPEFLFTQPGFYFLALPFTYLLPNILYAFYAALLVMTCIGGWGAYRLARLYCSPLPSITCMALFYTSHYLAINLFARGDLSEYSAMMLCPWAVFYFITLADHIKNRRLPTGTLIGLIITLFCLITMHPLVFIYCAFPGYAMLIGKWAEDGLSRRLPIITITCLMLALTLSSPYWFTATQMKAFINQGGVFVLPPAASMTQLFEDDFFNPGMFHVTLALLGWLCSRRDVFLRYVFFSYVFLFFLMTGYSEKFWQLDTPLKYSQFPWRVNSVLATVQLLGIIQLIAWLSHRIKPSLQPLFWPVIAASVVVFSMFSFVFPAGALPELVFKDPYRIWGPLNYENEKKEWEHKEFIYAGVYREFFPTTANYEQLPNRLTSYVPAALPLDHTKVQMADDSSPYHIHFSATTTPADSLGKSSVLINQMVFPGWKVLVNGNAALFTADTALYPDQPRWGLGDHGRLRIDVPNSDSYDIQAWYDGPPGWQWRNAIIILLCVIFIGVLRRQRQRL